MQKQQIIIPELEKHCQEISDRYVDAQSLCRIYSLKYREIKALGRECGAFKMMRKMAVMDIKKFEAFISSQYENEGGGEVKRIETDNPELASQVNSGSKKYVRYEEGAYLYSMGRKTFTDLAKEADAVRKIGGVCLVSIEKLNNYIEKELG